jgi:hypothetical protein
LSAEKHEGPLGVLPIKHRVLQRQKREIESRSQLAPNAHHDAGRRCQSIALMTEGMSIRAISHLTDHVWTTQDPWNLR